MDDNDESDSEVEILRKRKLNILEGEDTDESDEEDDDDDDDDGDESESEGDEESDNSDDNPLTDDVANDQCAICLMEFTDQKIGVPNMCTHVFCLGCIQEWAKNINTCPVDRKVFYTIAVKKGKNGVTLEEIKVEDRTQAKDEEEYEDPTTCEVCDTGDREDRMLLCDGCDRGFHLECLTPPLDSVPEEEWFCRDCFIDRSQDNTQELDTIDYSQHAIAFSDEEMPTLEPQSLPHAGGRILSNSRASTSQRRARTVATSRRRRQTSQATEESRQRRGRSRKRKKSAKKTKSAETGTSTATSRQKKKRKRRRRKKRRKARSNENVHQSTRYLLPREMEPTATFSLFGSDYDLEYLPVIETPVVTSKQPSPPRISTSSNPDVLGSIFSGLKTLHSDSLSVDNNGRLKIEESKTANQSLKKSPVSGASTHTASTSNKDTTASSSSASTHSCCTKNTFGPCPIHKNMCKQSNDQSIENSNESETASRKLIAEKRLKHFGGSVSASTFARPKVDLASSAKNRNFSSEFHPVRIPTLKCKESKLPTSNLATCNSSLGLSGEELNASQRSLASYKIPRKNPTSATSSSKSTSTSTSTSSLTATKGKSAGPIILKSCTKSRSPIKSSGSTVRRKNVRFSDVPEETSGILHLLPREVRKSHVIKTAVAKDDTSRKRENRDLSTSSITSSILPNPFNVSNADTFQTQAKADLRFANKNPSSKVGSSSSTSYPSTSQDFPVSYSLKHSELSKVAMQSKAKVASAEKNVHRDPLHNLTTAQTVQTTNIEPSRPVAVVHPTKIDENNSRETSQDAEAAKRRKEGIERLQQKQAICEELRRALKPFYAHREISKEDYKYIYTRAFEKISKSLLPVVSHGVAKLVRNFVKKLKGHQMHAGKPRDKSFS